MDQNDFIALGKQDPPLRFLVIGGYAVLVHGHSRFTNDFDMMVRRADSKAWMERIEAAGMRLFARTETFAQFSQSKGEGLDLMFATDETFEEIWKSSIESSFDGSKARLPSLDHLLALKLHALKHTQPHRTAKDMEDVEVLVQRNDIPLDSERYRELFLKYVISISMTHSNESSVVRDAALPSLDIELPPTEGLPPYRSRLSVSDAIQHNRKMRELYPKSLPTEEERWDRKRNFEFNI